MTQIFVDILKKFKYLILNYITSCENNASNNIYENGRKT